MRGITFTAAAALTLVLGWMVIAPLFVDQSVDESFRLTLADGRLNLSAIEALPEANRRLMKPRIMRAAAAVDETTTEPMPSLPSSPRTIARGQFADADAKHQARGTVTLYQLDGEKHLLRIENLKATNGPDLVLYLSQHPNPKSAQDVLGAEYLSLGSLKGNIGNQNYPIPIGTALNDYASVVIWCELFDVLFSPAQLTPAEPR